MEKRADDPKVVEFPPPFTEGQKEWFRRLTSHLRESLPEDKIEAQAVLAIVREALERRCVSQQMWKRTQLAAEILAMFPEDYRWGRQVVSLLFSSSTADGEEKPS